MPKLKSKQRRAQGMVEVIQPLFPRYLFVAPTNQGQSISPVRFTTGVSKLVRFHSDFEPVPQGMIEALQAREDPSFALCISQAGKPFREDGGLPNLVHGYSVSNWIHSVKLRCLTCPLTPTKGAAGTAVPALRSKGLFLVLVRCTDCYHG